MNLKDRLYQIFSIRWVQHLSFWSVFLLLEMGRITDLDPDRIPREVLFQGIQNAFIAILVYFNLRFLIPRYWNTGKYGKYLLIFIICEVFTIASLSYLFYHFPDLEFKSFIRLSTAKVVMMSTFKTNIFIFSTSLFHFAKEWMKLKDENLKYTEKAQEQLEAEISILKAQVNPHFLFNTLNNIYSMSLYDSNKTPEMILKLSQLISYMLYECKDEEVSLEKEIQFIKNYIDLESVRVEDIAKINLNISGEDPGHKVPPLLFIPLIENAFKHGISSEQTTSEINITLKISKHKIELEINNPLDDISEEQKKKQFGGLGIENVKKRLNLLFKNQHSFNISRGNGLYTSNLILQLS
ncbi:histidine kinase [Labilibaculum sp. DW002]|uniref:Histidine kinase n=1 Tax=Paralabilibaculum antarcticum TaxID=2912572 RepID=A0ABT5VMB5_9BACT|nr:histidine kinase [Labilibaculum sp. DW002]MDE5416571.1 histidine kinase [Labilibaculum sp. DW002]